MLLCSWKPLGSRIMSANPCFLLDVDECATGPACPAGICINTAGSYTCQTCRPGFGPSTDGLRCEGKKRFYRNTSLVRTDESFAYLWELVPFVQMLTSVRRVTCVLEGCAPTFWDPSPAPSVMLATDYPKTGRDVKVNSTSSFSFIKSH